METDLVAELQWLAAALVAASLAGAVYLLAAASAVRRFTARAQPDASASAPPVSVLKPVCGADADLYDCLLRRLVLERLSDSRPRSRGPRRSP